MSETFFDPCGEAFQRGMDHLQEGDAARAIPQFADAIHLDPQYVNARVARAFAFVQTGHAPAAIADCEAAIRLAPNLPQVFRLRAVAYRMQGENAKAEADLARADQLTAAHGAVSPPLDVPAGQGPETQRLAAMLSAAHR